jgi:type VI secretion system protein ImpG
MKDDDLLFYYQQELAFIRQLGAEFAEAHPKIAGRLRLGPKTSEDPHVSRLIEAFALSNARIRHKLDDEFPEISDALLAILHPHYLAPIPSMSIVQFTADTQKLMQQRIIADNTKLMIKTSAQDICYFTTRYATQLLPISVKEVELKSKPATAPIISAFSEASAVLKLSLQCTQTKLAFAELNIAYLRFFINAHLADAYALYELLFNHTLGIVLATSSDDTIPIILDKYCLSPVGFAEHEGMLPYNKRTSMGYRLLTEVFAFPEKFLFFDLIHLQKSMEQKFTQASENLIIYFYLNKTDNQLEKKLTANFFSLGCTPVINLFEKLAEPIELNHTQTEYQITPDANHAMHAIEVYDVKSVLATTDNGQQISYTPFYGIKHDGKATYYHLNRRPSWYGNHYLSEDNEVFLSFTDLQFNSLQADKYVISTDLYCTNRNLPAQLPYQNNTLHLEFQENKLEAINSIRCLTAMTPARRPALGQSARWRYISHLALHHFSLTDDETGINALRSIIQLYDFNQSEEHQRILEGLVNIKTRTITIRNPNARYGNIFWQGTKIILTVDQTKFSGTSLYLISCTLNYFFGLYATINSFTQLTIISTQKNELYQFAPRAGDKELI